MSTRFSFANEEKVVKPPQNPTVRNIRHSVDKYAERSNIPYKTPMIKQPVILTRNVPQGKEDKKIF
jgi:hypothetical protein